MGGIEEPHNGLRHGFGSITKYGGITLLVGVLLLPGLTFAQAIGEPEKTRRIGWGVALERISTDDPDGSTDTADDGFPVNVVFTDAMDNGMRYWVEGFHQKTSLDPSVTNIGQDVTRYGVRASVQRRFSLGQDFQMWGGVGGVLAHEEYTSRFTVDQDGFLAQRFDPDPRNENLFSIQFDITKEWSLAPKWDLAAKALYAVPLGDGVEELGVAVYLLWGRF
jgi:hypothetical protein